MDAVDVVLLQLFDRLQDPVPARKPGRVEVCRLCDPVRVHPGVQLEPLRVRFPDHDLKRVVRVCFVSGLRTGSPARQILRCREFFALPRRIVKSSDMEEDDVAAVLLCVLHQLFRVLRKCFLALVRKTERIEITEADPKTAELLILENYAPG